MKLKGLFLLLLSFIIIFPISVSSDEQCDAKSIKIESIEINDKANFVLDNNKEQVIDNTINLDLRMFNVDDYIEYKIMLKNNSNNNFSISKDSLSLNLDYINYKIKASDNSNTINANETKTLFLRVSYAKEVADDKFEDGIINDNKVMNLSFTKEDDLIDIINPATGFVLPFIIIVAIGLLSILLGIYYNKKLSANIFILIIGLSVIVPLVVHASTCDYSIQIKGNITIDKRQATFLPGQDVNIKMKNLAGDDTSTNGIKTENTSIVSIKRSKEEPTNINKEDKNVVSTNDSEYPIYMWYDDGTIYWWSEVYHPLLNEDASSMFRLLTGLTDISGLSLMDTKNSKNFSSLFSGRFAGPTDLKPMKISDFSPIENWNVSNVEIMSGMLAVNAKLKDLGFLSNWDVSNVTDMSQLFQYCSKITSLKPLKNWDVSEVTSFRSAFSGTSSLTSLDGLENWDVSSVTTMYGMFMIGVSNYNSGVRSSLSNISALSNWDVSNVETMQYMFQYNTFLSDFSPLKDWNTSSLTNTYGMFVSVVSMTDLSAFANWDVSNVTDMTGMFDSCTGLTDASAINDWDITNVLIFTGMFNNLSIHPDFTKVSGVWESDGSFYREDIK